MAGNTAGDAAGAAWPPLHPPFDLVQLGRSATTQLVPREAGAPALPLSTIPFRGIHDAPAWDDVRDLLEPPRILPPDILSLHQQVPSYELDARSLVHVEVTAPTSALEPQRNELTGAITGCVEVAIEDADANARNSFSLLRQPANPADFVRGRTSFRPFQPGGFVDLTYADDDDAVAAATAVAALTADEPLEHGAAQIGFGLVADGDVLRVADLAALAAANAPAVASFGSILFGGETTAPIEWTEKAPAVAAVAAEGSSASLSRAATGDEAALVDSLPTDLEAVLKRLPAPPASSTRRQYAKVIDVNQQMSNFHDVVPDMAIKYPFELDTFQKQAVYHLERGNCVFVAAHTSAGKTVVAEYAIALAQKHMTRAIYTSPIKALSNQKFRDFTRTFENVGLLTGDVQINKEASCLIMTTEILRSMLYRGADIIRDVEWVIFDEVHYVNDAERGVVWEEVIIMLPEHVGIIMLSATVPNYIEFADWVGRTKQKDVYVISTTKRPVPLEYYLFASKELHKIVDARREFLNDGYKRAYDSLQKAPAVAAGRGAAGGGGAGRGGGSASSAGPPRRTGPPSEAADRQNWTSLVTFLRDKALMPVVCFTLSKKRCESNANGLSSMDLTTSAEKSEIHLFIQSSFQRLKEVDRTLPQLLRMKEMMMRGIAVHHGGLLPIVKEVAEILFGRGLIKVLFATETFAMGVNMPARTVVFSDLTKHDGNSRRDLLPGEFTQMAGRAGRRGLDPVGVVIVPCWDKVPDASQLHSVMLGPPTKLESKFRLTYHMILNLLRVEQLRVEDMMKRSFSEFNAQASVPDQQRDLKKGRERLKQLRKLECSVCVPSIGDYYDATAAHADRARAVRAAVLSTPAAAKALSTGRVVVVSTREQHNLPAVILRVSGGDTKAPTGAAVRRTATVLALQRPPPADSSAAAAPPPRPLAPLTLPNGPTEPSVFEVALMDITAISRHRLENAVADSDEERARLAARLLVLAEESRDGFQALSPTKDLKIADMEVVEGLRAVADMEALLSQRDAFPCLRCAQFDEHYAQTHAERVLERQLRELEFRLSDKNLSLLPEYQQRLTVLRRLGYVDDADIVQLKGRVACELSNSDEVLVTELILENVLAELAPAELVALLSCFVFQEKSQSEPHLTDRLKKGVEKFREVARHVGELQHACGLPIAVDDYLAQLNFGLCEVVYEWALGLSFKQITDLTDVPEGSIVRCMVRLDETCRDVRNAARVIGDTALFRKAEEASALIKRDIIFAASLYY